MIFCAENAIKLVLQIVYFCGDFSTSLAQTICWFRDLVVKVPKELSERHQVLYPVALHEIQMSLTLSN